MNVPHRIRDDPRVTDRARRFPFALDQRFDRANELVGSDGFEEECVGAGSKRIESRLCGAVHRRHHDDGQRRRRAFDRFADGEAVAIRQLHVEQQQRRLGSAFDRRGGAVRLVDPEAGALKNSGP